MDTGIASKLHSRGAGPRKSVKALEIGIKHVGDELRELNYMCVKQSSSGPPFVGLFVTLSVGLPLIQYPTTAKERKYTFTPFYRFF